MAHIADLSPKNRFYAQPSVASELVPSRTKFLSFSTPNTTWAYVSIGFIVDLPPCTNPDGVHVCSVVVFQDRLTRQARFLPAPESPSASDVATLFINHVQSCAAPPKSLFWDRDPEPLPDDDARQFWGQLCLLLHVPISPLPTAADSSGQTSGSNNNSTVLPMAAAANRRILEQLIRGHTQHQQDSWSASLAVVEAAFNGTHPSATSANAPLLSARCGSPMLPGSAPSSPRGSMEAISMRATSTTSQQLPSTVAVHHFQLQEIYNRALQELQVARARYNVVRNMGKGSGSRVTNDSSGRGAPDGSGSGRSGSAAEVFHQEPHFRVGDPVRLSAAALAMPTQHASRLRPGSLGPFIITRMVSPVAYRLDLPPFLARVHPVFHVSRLLPGTEASAAPGPVAPGTPAMMVPLPPAPVESPVAWASPSASGDEASPPRRMGGDVVMGVSVSQGGQLQPAVLFHMRWAVPRSDGRTEGWEPYPAVAKLPAVREYLRGSEWREWKRSDEAQRFFSRWPDRMPRLVRFDAYTTTGKT